MKILSIVQIVEVCVIVFMSSEPLETFSIQVDRGGLVFMSLFTQGTTAVSLSGGGKEV